MDTACDVRAKQGNATCVQSREMRRLLEKSTQVGDTVEVPELGPRVPCYQDNPILVGREQHEVPIRAGRDVHHLSLFLFMTIAACRRFAARVSIIRLDTGFGGVLRLFYTVPSSQAVPWSENAYGPLGRERWRECEGVGVGLEPYCKRDPLIAVCVEVEVAGGLGAEIYQVQPVVVP